MKHGAAGYGIYFMIVEKLRESADYKCVKDYNAIAFDLRVDASIVKSIVEDFGLFAFTDDGECFYSESLLRRMNRFDEARKKYSDAGKSGGAPKGNRNASKKQASLVSKQTSLDLKQASLDLKQAIRVNKNKEKKIKESKTLSRDVDFDVEIFSVSDFKNSCGEIWLEEVGMKLHVPPDRLKSFFDEFCTVQELAGKRTSINDFKSHFINWLNLQIKKEKSSAKKEKNNETINSRIFVGEQDYGESTI
jgi:hypothetical protein